MATYRDKESDVGGGGSSFTGGGTGRIPYWDGAQLVDTSNLVWSPAIGLGIGRSPIAGYSVIVSPPGGSGAVRIGGYTGTSTNVISEFYIQCASNVIATFRVQGHLSAGTSHGLNNAGLIEFSQLSVVPNASALAVGTESNIPVYLYQNNVARIAFRDGNVLVNPTISAGAATNTAGTGAAGMVYVGNGTLPSTAPTSGFDLGAQSGHAIAVPVTGVATYLTGAQNEVSDANVVVDLTDRCTVHTSVLTTNRTITLPPAATTPNGWRHRVFSPLAMGGFNITVSGDINIGSAASFVINTPETGVEFEKCTATWRAI